MSDPATEAVSTEYRQVILQVLPPGFEVPHCQTARLTRFADGHLEYTISVSAAVVAEAEAAQRAMLSQWWGRNATNRPAG